MSFRHRGWHHRRQVTFTALQRAGASWSHRYRFAHCGSDAWIIRNTENPDEFRIAGSTCKSRWCVPCAAERGRAVACNIAERAAYSRCRFLTLTVRSSDAPLADAITRLYNAFQTLRRSKLWREHVTGGVAILEVTKHGQPPRWHPHLHCLVEGRYLPQRLLSRRWHLITGDSRIVDIRAVNDRRSLAKYVTKYMTKPVPSHVQHDTDALTEAIQAMSHRRTVTTFGTWRGALMVDHPSEGGWEIIGTLDDVLQAAARGDDEARRAIQAACGEHANNLIRRAAEMIPRSPPEKPRWDQLTLWDAPSTPFGNVTRPSKQPT